MISIAQIPSEVCFAVEPIIYQISTSSIETAPVLSFEIGYFNESFTGMAIVKIQPFPIKVTSEQYIHEVDLSDIISAYVRKYVIHDGSIKGHATFRLTSINNTNVSADANGDINHKCLPGTSGGLSITSEISSKVHPFLLARGNEQGSIHLYRSELRAMEHIYVLVSNAYQNYTIETDNRQSSDQDLSDKKINITGLYNIFGIWTGGDAQSQYYICDDANTLIVTFLHENRPRANTIAINDDPLTDESYIIRWTNSMGAPEALLITGELKDESEITDPELYISNQTLQSTIRKQKRRTVTTKYTIHTGYLTPARIIALRDMLSSEEVEMKIDGQWVPVSVTADPKHAVRQREPESFELTIEVLEQTRYHKPNRTVRPLPSTRAAFLQDNSGNLILDNNSNTIEENG